MAFLKGGEFFGSFLNTAFAKEANTRGPGFFHRLKGMKLAYPHDADFLPFPAAEEARVLNSFFYTGKGRGDIMFHGQKPPGLRQGG
jgi:hypothetical protein